jgi:hypothetical protein
MTTGRFHMEGEKRDVIHWMTMIDAATSLPGGCGLAEGRSRSRQRDDLLRTLRPAVVIH